MGCRVPSWWATPSMVSTSAPSAWTASKVQLFYRNAVDMNQASAALAGVATDMGAGEPQLLTQHRGKQSAILDLDAYWFVVNLKGDGYGH